MQSSCAARAPGPPKPPESRGGRGGLGAAAQSGRGLLTAGTTAAPAVPPRRMETDTQPCPTRLPCPASPLATAMVALSCREVLKDSNPKTFSSVFRTLPSRPGGAFPLILRRRQEPELGPGATALLCPRSARPPPPARSPPGLPCHTPRLVGSLRDASPDPLTEEGHTVFTLPQPPPHGAQQRGS